MGNGNWWVVLAMAAAAAAAPAQDRIQIEPEAGFIAGSGNFHSFVVSGHYADGSTRDLTRDCVYSVSDPQIVAPDEKGRFRALREGVAKVTAECGNLKADAALIVTPARSKTWEFNTDIAPIFSKLGCNNSNC